MKAKVARWTAIVAGVLLLAAGLWLVKTKGVQQGMMEAVPFVCIGIGCGLFGHGAGNVISERALRSDPKLRRKIEIERNDERSIAIANAAKGKAFDMMTFVFSALMLSFALMGVDMTATLLLVFSYLIVHGFALYYRLKLDREL
ncbi:hypothetical protein EII22_08665 [Coriobacteriales bacterium OH1046]|nr:hypothetical protein EII22_08665 [Coriobacteriales bacterium OH1046]